MNFAQSQNFAKKDLHLSVKPQAIPGCSIYSCVDEVTPRMAADWLDKHNTLNRKVRQGKIDQFAHDMLAGNWVLSHQGLAFDIDGRIVSGQHRLHAVVAANMPIQFMIFLNCPLRERAVIDQTSSRSVRDVASLVYADHVSSLHISVCRSMKYGMQVRGKTQMTPQETYSYLNKHRRSINSVLGLVTRKVQGVTTAGVLAAICRAYYVLEIAATEHFVEVLITGLSKGTSDKPIIMLRNFLLENKETLGGASGRSKAYAMTESALYAFMESETPDKLKPATKELFLLKGEKA